MLKLPGVVRADADAFFASTLVKKNGSLGFAAAYRAAST
jgi:hypothetical protein